MKKKFIKHLELAQGYWKKFLEKNYMAIDATCGNGHDSLFLAKLLVEKLKGVLYCYDIQKSAIEKTKILLGKNIPEEYLHNIRFIHSSHEDFSKNIKKSINLFVYNLGYLPNSDKTITTQANSTIHSLFSALDLLDSKGAISIMSYPGHPEGEKEQNALIEFLKSLDRFEYNVCYHKWINKQKAPCFFWIEKISN